jgi:amidase
MGSIQSWQDIASRKKALRDVALKEYLVDDISHRAPRVKNVDNCSRIETDPNVQAITDIDNLSILHQNICEGTFSAEDVILAYIKR